MKNLLTFIILLFSSFLHAQDSWVFDDENADIGPYIVELKQFKEDYILSLSYTNDLNIIKVHDLNTGEIVNEAKFPIHAIIDQKHCKILFQNFFVNYDSELIYIFGKVNSTEPPHKSYIIITKWDFNLNLVSKNLYKASDSYSTCLLYTIKYNDEYCVMANTCLEDPNSPDYYYYSPLIARFDLDVNLIDTLYINQFPEKQAKKVFDIVLKKEDNKGYWAFNHSAWEMASYDNSFNLIEAIEYPFDINGGVAIGGNRFDDSSYVIGFPFWSTDYDNYGYGTQIVKFDNNMNVLKRDTFVPEDMGAYVTFFHTPIDWYYKDHIYTGGFYFDSQVSFCISKYDSDLNLLWRKFIKYKDKDKYFMISMEATSDSCIVVGGNRKAYNGKTGERTYKPFIMKISPEGNTVATDEFEKSDWSITVYPNPSSGDFKLYVEGSHKSAKLHISNMQGRQIKVINTIKQGENHFNFGDIPQGIYVWTLEGKDGVIGSGKWVKK